MKEMKRILSLVLCLVMLIGLMPMGVLRADAEETVLDAAIFGSDVHGTTTSSKNGYYLSNVLAGAKNSGLTYSAIGFVGDTALPIATVGSTVNAALGYTPYLAFSYASAHDDENNSDMGNYWDWSGEVAAKTGEAYSDNYYIYSIRQDDMTSASNASSAATSFTSWVETADKTKPVFIISHIPMHDARDDNNGASAWFDAIQAAGEKMDIVFFWAHNHTEENNGKTRTADQAAYYVAKDGDKVLDVYNGNDSVPNFTYMNAGYINANNQSNVGRLGRMTSVALYADKMVFQDYTTTGAVSDTYSHNVTIYYEFASLGETEPVITLDSVVISGTAEYTVGDSLALTVTANYSEGDPVDVTNEVEWTNLPDMTAAGTFEVTATYEGVTSEAFTVTVKEKETEPAKTLTSIAITTDAEKTAFAVGEEFTSEGMVVTAYYDDDTSAEVTGYTVSGYDMTTIGTQTVTVAYEGLTTEYEITVGVFYSDDMFAAVHTTASGATLDAVVEDEQADALLSYWYGYDISLESEDSSASVILWLDDQAMTSEDFAVYYLNETTGKYEPVTKYTVYVDEEGFEYITISNAAMGTYVYGTPASAIPEGAVLDSLTVVAPIKRNYFDTDAVYNEDLRDYVIHLDITGLEVTANYVDGDQTHTETLEWDQFGKYEGGYALTFEGLAPGSYGAKTVTVSYGDVSETFTVYVCMGDATVGEFAMNFTQASVVAMGVETVEITDDITAAVAEHLNAENLVVYDFTPTYANGDTALAGEASITLPIPAGIVNPLVCFVSENGEIEEMSTVNNGDGTLTFTTDHFSTFVVGEDGTRIPTGNEGATVDGTEDVVTTTKVADEYIVYKLATTLVSGNQYLIVNSNTGTGYGLDGDTTGYATNAFTGGSDYYSFWDDTTKSGTAFSAGSDVYLSTDGAYLWTAGSNSFTIGYTQSSSGGIFSDTKYSYTLNPSGSDNDSWNISGNNLTINLITISPAAFWESDTYEDFYLTNSGSSWSMATGSGSNVYFYEPVTIYKVTETETTIPGTEGGTYTVEGTNVETYAVANATVDLSSTLTFTTTSGTASNPTGWTANYEVVSDKGTPAVISSINGNVATLSGTVGTAIVKVTYTNGTLTAWDEFGVTAKAPSYGFSVTDPESNQLKIGAGLTLVANPTMNGTAMADQTITWTSSDEKIATVDENGSVTAKAAGDVTITATWTDPSGKSHSDTVSLSVVDAIYALDLCEPVYTQATAFAENTTYFTLSNGVYTAATGVTAENFAEGTYYTQTTKSITETIVKKNVTAGQTYTNLWAVITADGKDIGALNEEQLKNLSFTSSDSTIATVDSATGVVTFQGETGTVRITAIYEYADGEQVTDTVEISVSEDGYTRPEDGTSVDNVPDFPEYPNQGAIRFDKNATAVGNFSETGVAKVELSMTGVPYGTSTATDVVVMVDMTSSMETNDITAAKLAVQELIETVVYDEENDTYDENIHLFVSSFSSGTTTSNIVITDHLDDVTISNSDELTAAKNAITDSTNGFRDDRHSTNGTHYGVALADVYATLNRDGHADNQFVVFVTDGVPTRYYYLNSDGSYTEVTGSNSDTKSLAAGWFDDEGEVTEDFQTEYYTYLIKEMGIPVYTVGANLTALSDAADLINHMSSNYSSDGKTSTGETKYSFTCTTSGGITDEVLEIFRGIGADIREAAKDVVVSDQITDEYTMIFDAPNTDVGTADGDQEYYIEVKEYSLEPVTENGVITNYIRDTATSKIKLYLGYKETTGYYAASDANGTEFAEPTFNQTALGTKFYWTTESGKGDSDVQVTVDGTTYYFVSTGIKNTDEDFDSTKWFNMASGAYASGTKATTGENAGTSQDLIIATPYFVYNAATRMLTWTAEKLNSTELALTYFLYLERSGGYSGETNEIDAGTYETNVKATITYTNVNNKECQQVFPIPQMTWNGAQVHYVFYLVNEAGQPVNRAGRVIPFSEAIYVTDVFHMEVVWNDFEELAELSADYLAYDKVPDVYELYDTSAKYEIHVFEKENEENLNNHFIISGSNSVTNQKTTHVFNTESDETKYNAYGAYAASNRYKCKDYNVTVNSDGSYTYNGTETQVTDNNGNALYGVDEAGKTYAIIQKSDATTVYTGFDFSNTTVAFAVVWKPELVADTVVIDYGLDVVVNVVENDALSSGVVGVYNVAPSTVEINKGTYTNSAPVTSATLTRDGLNLATATLDESNNNVVKVSLDKDNGMLLNDPLVFYYESSVNYYVNNELKNDNMYSTLTVIPATTVYYEDEYVTLKSYVKDEDGNYQEVTTGSGWQDSESTSKTQATDRPGANKIGGDYDADNIYGYDKAYANSSTYSMGNAAMVTVNAEKYATAEFEFYGTGFDVISLTSNTTGTILVRVYPWDEGAGNYSTTHAISRIVDTYYGYTKDADGNWVLSTNTPNSLYQVPVIKIADLTYGRYKAVITCDYNVMFDHNDSGSYDFYLDAIRIYDPAGESLDDLNDTEEKAYAADGELLPNYYELRNWLISADKFNSTNLTYVNGIVFIDSNDGTNSISDYSNYGPNNELYLAPGQAIAFNLNAGNETDIPAGYVVDQVHIAYKSVGGTAYAKIYDPAATTMDDAETLTVSTATDLYFNITALNDGNVVIVNAGTTGNAILSITNVKVTYKVAENVEQAKTSLRNYLNAVGTLTEANYTEDSWTSYNKALSAANTELENTEATIESVTKVHAELKTAYEALELKDAANEASVANVFTVTAAETGVALMSLRRTVVDDETTEEETTEPTEPEATVPETTEPEVTEPEATVPETTEPEVTEPEATVPETTEPEVTEPENDYQQSVDQIVETAKKVYNFISNLFSRWF